MANVEPHWEPISFAASDSIEPSAAGDWANYAKAATQALCRHHVPIRGLEGVVSGNIPVAAGLSSSSALVVAVALTLIEVNGISVEKLELMNLLANGEHYVGTQGGGMDQAICLGGKFGFATVIEFHPLGLTPVAVPESWSFRWLVSTGVGWTRSP